MSQSETTSQAALQSPSLVLVAPMPRRPIALVARRHHHHHHSSSHSRSRSSRTVSGPGTKALTDEAKGSPERGTSPHQPNGAAAVPTLSTTNVRTIGHPYSRSKTPSNANSHSNPVSPAAAAAALAGMYAWPLGLGISPVSPPPRSRTASRDGMASRPLSRLSMRDNVVATTAADIASIAAVTLETIPDAAAPLDGQLKNEIEDKHANESMMTSPIVSPSIRSASVVMDVERTPTKSTGRAHHSVRKPRAEVDDDQEPRSTPTLGATSPRPPSSHTLTLSPTSPTEQRITAAASASAQLALAFSSPPSDAAAVANSVDTQLSPRQVDAASITPSPTLSESQSRSPSASPSPCPSPAFSTLLDLEPPLHSKHADQPRKMGLPLPPLPSSPIPRKMTRNPFERYLGIDSARDASCALHARLALAVAGAKQPRSVLEGMESHLMDADEEMVVLEDPVGCGMEVEE